MLITAFKIPWSSGNNELLCGDHTFLMSILVLFKVRAFLVKERVGGGGQLISWHFDCTSQGKAAHGHVVYAVQEVPFWHPLTPFLTPLIPEMSVEL
jgi:hypothetical protein